MIRSQFASAIALAALLAAPVYAQTTASTTSSTTGTAADQHSGAMTSSTQKAATPRNKASTAQRAAADQGRTPLCSELGNPNAGKLADKATGQAQDHSASAVHMDCIPDGSTAASVGAGTTTDVTNTARQGSIAGSTTGMNSNSGTASGSMASGTNRGSSTTDSSTTNSTPTSGLSNTTK